MLPEYGMLEGLGKMLNIEGRQSSICGKARRPNT